MLIFMKFCTLWRLNYTELAEFRAPTKVISRKNLNDRKILIFPNCGGEKYLFYYFTMLQKLSKCEVKAWLCWDLIILPPLRFYVKSNFGKFKRSKNVIFGNCRASELRNLVNLALDCAQIYQKSKFRSSKIVKNNIFEPFEFTKILFHAKSEWQ